VAPPTFNDDLGLEQHAEDFVIEKFIAQDFTQAHRADRVSEILALRDQHIELPS
jgi:hypothetical protein